LKVLSSQLRHLKLIKFRFPMDATESKASVVIKFHNIVNETTSHFCPSLQQIPLTANPSILLHVLSSYGLEPKDLAALEASAICTTIYKIVFSI
jgi:hypothetical protein